MKCHLEKSLDRKQYMQQQLEKHLSKLEDYDIHFFVGVNGNETPQYPLFLKHYNDKKAIARKGRSLSLGQLGCYASHFLLWQKCLELNTPLLILEDDAKLRSNFSDVLKFATSEQNHYEFFWLQPTRTPKTRKKQIENLGEFSIYQFTHGFGGTTGYYLTPKAAKKFIAQSQEWIYPVDNTMDLFWKNKVPFYGIEPACIISDDSKFNSIIGDFRQGVKRSLFIKCKREFFEIATRLQRFWFNLNHF